MRSTSTTVVIALTLAAYAAPAISGPIPMRNSMELATRDQNTELNERQLVELLTRSLDGEDIDGFDFDELEARKIAIPAGLKNGLSKIAKLLPLAGLLSLGGGSDDSDASANATAKREIVNLYQRQLEDLDLDDLDLDDLDTDDLETRKLAIPAGLKNGLSKIAKLLPLAGLLPLGGGSDDSDAAANATAKREFIELYTRQLEDLNLDDLDLDDLDADDLEARKLAIPAGLKNGLSKIAKFLPLAGLLPLEGGSDDSDASANATAKRDLMELYVRQLEDLNLDDLDLDDFDMDDLEARKLSIPPGLKKLGSKLGSLLPLAGLLGSLAGGSVDSSDASTNATVKREIIELYTRQLEDLNLDDLDLDDFDIDDLEARKLSIPPSLKKLVGKLGSLLPFAGLLGSLAGGSDDSSDDSANATSRRELVELYARSFDSGFDLSGLDLDDLDIDDLEARKLAIPQGLKNGLSKIAKLLPLAGLLPIGGGSDDSDSGNATSKRALEFVSRHELLTALLTARDLDELD
ncbi:hypothetical protein EWM64_g1253 [Hericium alpestre]|uniref:Uncharacterized protein n=1 Tax=Hericium alpestre TaxID=135208 RepID=A0A4Z0A8C3_9AGAM|nr:hypothetical protein EWM64_g1253 [Hericium alpestre]